MGGHAGLRNSQLLKRNRLRQYQQYRLMCRLILFSTHQLDAYSRELIQPHFHSDRMASNSSAELAS